MIDLFYYNSEIKSFSDNVRAKILRWALKNGSPTLKEMAKDSQRSGTSTSIDQLIDQYIKESGDTSARTQKSKSYFNKAIHETKQSIRPQIKKNYRKAGAIGAINGIMDHGAILIPGGATLGAMTGELYGSRKASKMKVRRKADRDKIIEKYQKRGAIIGSLSGLGLSGYMGYKSTTRQYKNRVMNNYKDYVRNTI